jgi:hypothetical protein
MYAWGGEIFHLPKHTTYKTSCLVGASGIGVGVNKTRNWKFPDVEDHTANMPHPRFEKALRVNKFIHTHLSDSPVLMALL